MIESVELTSAGTLSGEDAEGVPLEALETEICELAGHLAAATCRFLRLIADFDERRGWASWEQRSCSAWLAWKCQVAPGTAREYVRVARALRGLPLIEAEFAAGRMSYAKARALTRIATPETEAGLADLAGPMTAAQLERFVAAHRRVSSVDDERARAMRRLAWRTEEDGQFSMSVQLPAEEGAVLLQALRAAAGDLEHLYSYHSGDESPPAEQQNQPTSGAKQEPASLLDALLHLASGFLTGKVATSSNPDIYQVIVHVGMDVFDEAGAAAVREPADPARCHLQDGPAISPVTARRLACQSMVSWMLRDRRGNVLDVGRRQRRPPPALRRAVLERDGYRCEHPGCNSRKVDIHHIVPWALGGKTRLKNLIGFCEPHHIIVHERGYQVVATDDGFELRRADGTLVPASPELPGGSDDLSGQHDAPVTAETISPIGLGEPLNLHETIWACFANSRVEAERREAATAHAA